MTSLERTLPRPGDWVMWVSLPLSFWCWTHNAQMRLNMSAGTAGIFLPTKLRSRTNQQMRKLFLKQENRFHSLIHTDTTTDYKRASKVYHGLLSICMFVGALQHQVMKMKKKFLIVRDSHLDTMKRSTETCFTPLLWNMNNMPRSHPFLDTIH